MGCGASSDAGGQPNPTYSAPPPEACKAVAAAPAPSPKPSPVPAPAAPAAAPSALLPASGADRPLATQINELKTKAVRAWQAGDTDTAGKLKLQALELQKILASKEQAPSEPGPGPSPAAAAAVGEAAGSGFRKGDPVLFREYSGASVGAVQDAAGTCDVHVPGMPVFLAVPCAELKAASSDADPAVPADAMAVPAAAEPASADAAPPAVAAAATPEQKAVRKGPAKLAEQPAEPAGQIVLLECRGGKDKGKDGHRRDTVAICNAVIERNWACKPLFYADAGSDATACELEAADGVIVRVGDGDYIAPDEISVHR